MSIFQEKLGNLAFIVYSVKGILWLMIDLISCLRLLLISIGGSKWIVFADIIKLFALEENCHYFNGLIKLL